MIRDAITTLVTGDHLSGELAYETMKQVMAGDATPAQIGAYITALRIRGETAEIIQGSARAMRENFVAIEAPTGRVVDTCGTGGDGAHTFNVSTASAFVAAGAGITVAKHGNRSVSSLCGSADVLTALGVNIGVDPSVMVRCLNEIGIAFLFAPSLHPAMKHAIGPRREIGIRTVFNILGPLSNPAGARHGVLGVYSAELVPLMAVAASTLDAKHMFIVHGNDGLDEITTTTTSVIAEVRDGHVKEYELDPQTLGLPRARPENLTGGTPEENAEILRRILRGEKGPSRDIVLINAAAAIVAGGQAADLQEGIAAAAAAIDNGKALDKLERLAAITSANDA